MMAAGTAEEEAMQRNVLHYRDLFQIVNLQQCVISGGSRHIPI